MTIESNYRGIKISTDEYISMMMDMGEGDDDLPPPPPTDMSTCQTTLGGYSVQESHDLDPTEEEDIFYDLMAVPPPLSTFQYQQQEW